MRSVELPTTLQSAAVTGPPPWLRSVLGVTSLDEGVTVEVRGQTFVVRDGIPRSQRVVSAGQAQTRDTFGFKWKKRDTFESSASLARIREWLISPYGDVASA